MMWNILCFGDSNTFGYDTVNDSRFPWGIRWTSLVQEKLGEEYRIIEEGMGGRTTVWDDPVECLQSGKIKGIPQVLPEHRRAERVLVYGSVGVRGSL